MREERGGGDSCIDCAANPRLPSGLSWSTSLLLFKEETLTAVSRRALNPSLIDIEFPDALMPAAFVPAAWAIELYGPDMLIISVIHAFDIFFLGGNDTHAGCYPVRPSCVRGNIIIVMTGVQLYKWNKQIPPLHLALKCVLDHMSVKGVNASKTHWSNASWDASWPHWTWT